MAVLCLRPQLISESLVGPGWHVSAADLDMGLQLSHVWRKISEHILRCSLIKRLLEELSPRPALENLGS